MRFLTGLFRLAAALGVLGAAAFALLALFGFAVDYFDLLNHLQLALFAGTLVGVALVVLIFPRGRARTVLALVGVVGFVASAAIVVPEAVSGLLPRPPLPTDGRPVLKLMTHNLFGRNDDMALVMDIIRSEDPDIVALQEYFSEQAEALHPRIIGSYPYFARCEGGKRANIGLYSRLPFTETMSAGACPEDAYGSQRTAHITATFEVDGARFSIINTHLDWPVPIERQREELARLADDVRATELPTILVGDFNSTPWSYALRGFEAEAGLSRHTRNLPTFPTIWYYLGDWRAALPVLPLDHVMSRNGIMVHAVAAAARSGSDHLPVVATFSLPRVGSGG